MTLHSHRNQIQYLETIRGLTTMIRDPGHTESVFDIEDGLQNLEAYKLAVEYVRNDPAMAQLMKERYLRHGAHDLDALLKLPETTLGYRFARHLRDRGFDPDYFRVREVHTDLDYVLMRLRQTHDIWHVVTGFDTEPIGELGIKAVELAQTRRPMAAVVAAGGVLRFLYKDPEHLGEVLGAVSEGYQMGIKAKLLLAQKWEDHWERPLEEWRAMLNVTPAGTRSSRA
ncbi:MAG: Coq4 family protein [Terracidiphilus sp.]|jgi:ubiquinone biosynthesis protein Coq4